LGKMSFGILQSFFKRLSENEVTQLKNFNSQILMQFQSHNNKFEAIEINIKEEERPPMITIPEYTEKKKSWKQ
ncbi:MAG: glucosyl-3-phosphoglycerate synthase, partial [Spirochaetaceae bacterium]|nr:glucosyl-3-phosphoglycerate synthase [Spirochaetaceae bacterium]